MTDGPSHDVRNDPAHSDGASITRGSQPGSWLARLNQDEIELLDPLHPDFTTRVNVLASGARVADGMLEHGYEMLCIVRDVIYLIRQVEGRWVVVHCEVYVDEDLDIDELGEGFIDPRTSEQVEGLLDMAETELLPPSEYYDWLEGDGSSWNDTDWSQEIVDGEPMWVPSARFFLDMLNPVLSPEHTGSSGPLTSPYIEQVFDYEGHRFIVTGDPEDGDLYVDLYVEDEMPDGWIHPLSMMVDVNGRAVSIGEDEDGDEWYEDSLGSDDEDNDDDPSAMREQDQDLREIRRVARQMLADLRIVHDGIEIVGPNASPVLPSEHDWLAFPTAASLSELDAKVGRIFTAEVSGQTMLFTDNMDLSVAARLSDFEPIIRITHDTVEVADPGFEVIVARQARLPRADG